jgi:hypothetical protein
MWSGSFSDDPSSALFLFYKSQSRMKGASKAVHFNDDIGELEFVSIDSRVGGATGSFTAADWRSSGTLVVRFDSEAPNGFHCTFNDETTHANTCLIYVVGHERSQVTLKAAMAQRRRDRLCLHGPLILLRKAFGKAAVRRSDRPLFLAEFSLRDIRASAS